MDQDVKKTQPWGIHRHGHLVHVARSARRVQKQAIKSKTLQLLLQPADKKAPPQLVAEFDLASLKKLPQQSFTTHTPWFKDPMTFTGPLIRDVLASAKLKGTALSAVGLDSTKPNCRSAIPRNLT